MIVTALFMRFSKERYGGSLTDVDSVYLSSGIGRGILAWQYLLSCSALSSRLYAMSAEISTDYEFLDQP